MLIIILLLFLSLDSSPNQHANFTGACEQQLEHVGELKLSDTHLYSGWGSLSADTYGNYLIADLRNAKVLLYSPDGELLSEFGRRGRGPGDFEIPSSILRSSSGTVYVSDMFGRITVLDQSFNELESTISTDLLRVSSLVELNENQLMLYGLHPNFVEEGELIHILDKDSKEIVHSYFEKPELTGEFPSIISQSERMVNIAIGEDQVAVVHSLDPKIYVYNNDFELRDAVTMQIPEFIPIQELQPVDFQDISVFTKFSSISRLYFLSEKTLLMQTSRRLNMDPERFEYDDSYKARSYAINLEDQSFCKLNIHHAVDYVDSNTNRIYTSYASKRYVYQIYKQSEQ